MHINYAVVDRFYNILSGSPAFFSFFSATNFLPLLAYIHQEDVATFKSAISSLTIDTPQNIMCRIKDKNNSYQFFYLKLKRIENLNDYNIHCEFINIEQNDTDAIQISSKNLVYRKIMSLSKVISFEYTPHNNIFRIFTVDLNRDYNLYCDTLEKISTIFLEKGLIHITSANNFLSMLNDIKSLSLNFSYKLHSAIASNDKKHKDIEFIGGTIYSDDDMPIVCGIIKTDLDSSDFVYKNDPMTGILNKPSIISYAKHKLANTNNNVILAIIDIDNFKTVNDTMGHSFGDTVIIKFTNILTSIVGNKGAVGRFGGDEFIVIFDNLNGVDEIRTYFRAIRSTIEIELKHLTETLSITCSIGIASTHNVGRDYDTLFKLADSCLYLAKDYGKNRYIYYDLRAKESIENKKLISETNQQNINVSEDNEFIFNVTQQIFNLKENNFENILKLIGEHYNLQKIKIYTGSDLKLSNYWSRTPIQDIEQNANYVSLDSHLSLFDSDYPLIVNNVDSILSKSKTTYDELKKIDVASLCQYLIKFDNELYGVISFERTKKAKCWTDSEIRTFIIASQLIVHTIEQNVINQNIIN